MIRFTERVYGRLRPTLTAGPDRPVMRLGRGSVDGVVRNPLRCAIQVVRWSLRGTEWRKCRLQAEPAIPQGVHQFSKLADSAALPPVRHVGF